MIAKDMGLAIPAQRFGVSTSGTSFIKNGAAVRGIGVNHWSSFIDEVAGVPTVYKSDIAAIKQTYGLPFARVSFGFYDRSSMYSLWYQNKPAFFGMLDQYVAECESKGLGLIAVLVWDVRGFADCCYDITGAFEPVRNLAYKHTNAWKLFAEYITSIVDRYKNSPAIWSWELSNEPGIGAEMWYGWKMDGTDAVIGANLNWGTRPSGGSYAPTDKMSIGEYMAFTEAFVTLVKSLDPHKRMVTSGYALGNAFAVNAQTNNAATADTLAQWNSAASTENLPWVTYRDKKFDANVAHIYPQALTGGRFFNGAEKTGPELIALCKGWADLTNRPFFLGEFGATYHGDPVDELSTNLSNETSNFNAALAAVQSNNVQLSALWNWGGDLAGANAWQKWKLTDPSRTYQLDAIAVANAAMQ